MIYQQLVEQLKKSKEEGGLTEDLYNRAVQAGETTLQHYGIDPKKIAVNDVKIELLDAARAVMAELVKDDVGYAECAEIKPFYEHLKLCKWQERIAYSAQSSAPSLISA